MMNKSIKKYLRLCQLFIAVLLIPAKAHADAGVPMIFVTLPGMLAALIPIILIESIVMSKQLAITPKQSLKAAFYGNTVSTIVGIPVTWVVLVVIQICTGGGMVYGVDSPLTQFLAVTWQAPWLIPYDSEMKWMIPSATISLLVPFFFASWRIEYRIAKRQLKEIDQTQLNAAVRNANLVSYGLLALIALYSLYIAVTS